MNREHHFFYKCLLVRKKAVNNNIPSFIFFFFFKNFLTEFFLNLKFHSLSSFTVLCFLFLFLSGHTFPIFSLNYLPSSFLGRPLLFLSSSCMFFCKLGGMFFSFYVTIPSTSLLIYILYNICSHVLQISNCDFSFPFHSGYSCCLSPKTHFCC